MAIPNPRRSPFAVQPKAPLRGKGPSAPQANVPDFAAVAKARAEAGGQAKARTMTPMSAGAPPWVDTNAPQGGGYAGVGTKADTKKVQEYGGANSRPETRTRAVEKFGAGLDEQKKLDAIRVQPETGPKGPRYAPGGGDNVNPFAAEGGGIANARDFQAEQKAKAAAKEKAKADAAAKEAQHQADMKDPQKNPGPGWGWDNELGQWQEEPMPVGVTADDPAWTYTTKDGWVYDQNVGSTEIDAQLGKALASKPEDYGMSPELLSQNMAKIDRQGSDAKAKLSQQLAGRGLGASGLAGTGFGNIDVGTVNAKTDLETQNFQTGIEARLNELKTLLTAHGNELTEANRRAIAKEMADLESQKFEYEKTQNKEADKWSALHDVLIDMGGDQWSADALAWAQEQADAGVPWNDIIAAFQLSPDNILKLKDAQAKDESKAGGNNGASGETSPGSDSQPKDAEPPVVELPKKANGNAGGNSNGMEMLGVLITLYQKYEKDEKAAGRKPWAEADWIDYQMSHQKKES